MGRKTTYTDKLATVICDRIASGETLRAICREEGMPSWKTVYSWRQANEEFASRIACAREEGFDAIAEEALAIADTPCTGVRTEMSEDGIKRTTEDMLGHRKLQVETRLKLLAKWAPKKYGDKMELEHVGKGGGAIRMSFSATDADL